MATMDLPTLQAFQAAVQKDVPSFKLAYKDTTWWMKVLGFFSAPFNPTFMTGYITTLGNTVYFPSQSYYEGSPKSSFSVLAHEYVHLKDSAKYPILYQLSYALPQCLSPLVLLAYMVGFHMAWLPVLILALGVVLGCWASQKSVALFFVVAGAAFVGAAVLAILFSHWWAALFFGGLILLAPLPSPGRTHWELRGYAMTLAVMAWTYGTPPTLVQEMIAKYFYGPAYFFMSWSKNSIYTDITSSITNAQNGTLQKDDPYGFVYDFLSAQNQLLTPPAPASAGTTTNAG